MSKKKNIGNAGGVNNPIMSILHYINHHIMYLNNS